MNRIKISCFFQQWYIYLKNFGDGEGVNDHVWIYSRFGDVEGVNDYAWIYSRFLFIKAKNDKNTTDTEIQFFIIYIISFVGLLGRLSYGHQNFSIYNVFCYPCNTPSWRLCFQPFRMILCCFLFYCFLFNAVLIGKNKYVFQLNIHEQFLSHTVETKFIWELFRSPIE